MQTTPVATPSPLASPSSPPNRQQDSESSTSFNQVLSREVAERQNTTQQSGTEQADKPAATSPSDQAAPAKGKNNASTSTDSETAEDASSSAAQDAASAAPLDLLALVAGVNQFKNPASASSDAERNAAGSKGEGPGKTDALLADALSMQATLQASAATSRQATGTILAAGDDKTASVTRSLNPGQSRQKSLLQGQGAEAANMQAQAAGGVSVGAKATLDFSQELTSAAQTKADFHAEIKDTLATLPAPALQATQQLAMQATREIAATTADKLTPPVGSPAWDQALGQKVVWMVAGEQQTASLTLNPPDLGPLQVVLNVSNSQANATFTAAQPEVRQALEAALPKLRDMLGEAGIQLGQATVSSGQSNHQQQPEQKSFSQAPGIERNEARNDGALRTARVQPAVGRRGMVDTFV